MHVSKYSVPITLDNSQTNRYTVVIVNNPLKSVLRFNTGHCCYC